MKTNKGANRETPIKGQSCAKLRKSIKYDSEKAGYIIYFFSESPETIELHISATKQKYD